MESLDKLEVKKEIDGCSLSSSDNIDNSVWESLKKKESLTDLQQDAMESKTDYSLATDQSVGNHRRYGTKEDHWRSPSSSVSNDQESKIYGNDLEKRCETLSFGLNPTTHNEEDVPLVKVLVKLQEAHPEAGCPSWNDVNHSRDELAEDHVGACDPLVTIMENCICDRCGFETSSLKILKHHKMKEHSDEKKFHCKFCDYKCSTSSHLKSHERIHTGEKPFNCKFCDYKCSTSSHLKRHVKTHTGEKPFNCKFCDYKCSTSTDLKSHERIHTGEKKFNCKFCDYKCSKSTDLKFHERTHTGEKPYNCKFCDYKCSRPTDLKSHERTHTGEKPYNCKFCDYKCSRPTDLKQHVRIHTGEKPFHCEFCDYECSTSCNLKRHVRTHTGEKSFHCEFCDYKCSHSSQLKRHERTHTIECT